MKTVAVLGGTGFVGRALCRQLDAGGRWRVRVVTREPSRAAPLAGLPCVGVEVADVHVDASLRTAIAGADAVVNLVAILHGSAGAFRQAHVELPRRLARACAHEGRPRLAQVSALGVGPDAHSLYLRSKTEGERALREHRPDAVLLRPSVIFGREDRFLNTFERLQRFAPIVPLACSDALFQPVWVEDVASALVACLERSDTDGATFECAGPDVLTLRQLVELAGRRGGVRRPVVALPPPLATIQAWVMEHLPGEPLMTRDNLLSMRTPNVATPGAPSLRDLGIVARSLQDDLALDR